MSSVWPVNCHPGKIACISGKAKSPKFQETSNRYLMVYQQYYNIVEVQDYKSFGLNLKIVKSFKNRKYRTNASIIYT